MKDQGIGLICLAGLMRILKGPLIEEFENRIMNIHPALLPSFPGLDSQKKALEYGVRFSGCTVHYVDAGTDTGPIILQSVVPVQADDTVDTLSARILAEEHRIYPEAVRLHCAGKLKVEGRIVRISEE
jgi:phosphoribosylglycinamide formyltransferase-1